MARYAELENWYATDLNANDPDWVWVLFKSSVVTGYPWSWATVSRAGRPPHFPYGIAVLPDH